MSKGLSRPISLLALCAVAIAGCGGGGISTPTPGQPVQGPPPGAGVAPAGPAAAQAIAAGRASSFARARDDESTITATPKQIVFESAQPQTVNVTVSDATAVYAGSSDSSVASVSPGQQTVSGPGGTIQFTITPHVNRQRAALICFVTLQWSSLASLRS